MKIIYIYVYVFLTWFMPTYTIKARVFLCCVVSIISVHSAVSGKKDKDKDQDPGIIMYDVNGTKQTIPFSISVILGAPPNNSDKVLYMCISSVATSSMS